MTPPATSVDHVPTVEEPSAAGRRTGGAVGRVLLAALKTRRGLVGALLALIVLAVAFLGPFVPGQSPTAFEAPPFSKPGVGGAGLLGTDGLGRSVLARLLDGGHTLILLGIAS